MVKGYHGSQTAAEIRDCWQTPVEIINRLDAEFKFTMDVAASITNHKFANYYTESDNSLEQSWGLVNWCNPPYSNITPWIEKAIEQHKLGKTIVMLIPADTSVGWFKLAYESCNEVRLITGRISFINAETQKPVSGNNKGSVLFIWRAHCKHHSVDLIHRDSLMVS